MSVCGVDMGTLAWAGPDGYRLRRLALWLDLEVGRLVPVSSDRQSYRDTIAEVGMFALVDMLEQPGHRALSRHKDLDGPTLYRALVDTNGILQPDITEVVWEKATQAADAVLWQLDAGTHDLERTPVSEVRP